ncbi:putative TATA element modulatory factor isoform X2, partial [Apostichopus japonicus]
QKEADKTEEITSEVTQGEDGVQGDSQNPMHPEKLLKKLADMAEILKAREDQIITLSEQNNQLQDTGTSLKIKLEKLERRREQESEEDLTSLTTEFTERIGIMEKKLHVANKERDGLKKEVQTLKTEITERDSTDQSQRLLAEKDLQITALTKEGEKLAKEQLQNSTIIKKLRIKEKENDSLIKSQKEQLEDALKKIEYLEGVIDAKEEVDKKNKADLHKSIAAKNSEAHEHNLSSEMNAKEEMRLAMEKLQQGSRREHEGLILQINDLQMSLSRGEQQSNRKEMNLRQEISDLQQALQDSEQRNQELSHSVTGATRPLLRQIENLQSTFNDQSQTWEQVERNLTERLADAQAQLAGAVEKERSTTETAMMATSKVSSLESQLALLRQEKSKLLASLEMEKMKAQSLEEQKDREHSQFESQRHTYIKALEDSQREKDILEKKVQVESLKAEAEKKRAVMAQEALEEKERQTEQEKRISPINISGSSTPTRPILTPTLSISSQSEILERSMSISGERLQHDSLMNGSASTVIENLQSHVKLKEGEVAQLQGEITQLERTRASMAEEIVKLANLNETLEDEVKVVPELTKKMREIDHKYNAVLQMYGEKAEEVTELRLDIQEIKEMYRQQIEDLLKKDPDRN